MPFKTPVLVVRWIGFVKDLEEAARQAGELPLASCGLELTKNRALQCVAMFVF